MNTLIFLFSLLISAGCFWMSLKLLRLYFRVKKWQQVRAKVISKEVALHQTNSTPKAPYGLKVNYSYPFNNSTYNGNTVYLVELAGGQVNMMKSDAEKRLAKIGTDVSVFINPDDPSQSVMYDDGIGVYVFIFCLGILSLLIGLISLLS